MLCRSFWKKREYLSDVCALLGNHFRLFQGFMLSVILNQWLFFLTIFLAKYAESISIDLYCCKMLPASRVCVDLYAVGRHELPSLGYSFSIGIEGPYYCLVGYLMVVIMSCLFGDSGLLEYKKTQNLNGIVTYLVKLLLKFL